MDARVKSAFARVHSPSKTGVNALEDALLPAHDELVTTSVDIALFGARAGPVPVFSCFSADSESSIPALTISSTHTSSFPRRVSAPGVLHPCFTHPESRGGRSAEKRSGAALSTRWACHLASKTRVNALMTRDARLSALHRGGFSPGAALPSPSALAVLQRRAVAFGSVQRAPRSQVVVPGGRLPGPPGANGYEPPPQDATPRSAFRIVSGDAPR